jgi:tetratricopeptide (TPR) repeat protein
VRLHEAIQRGDLPFGHSAADDADARRRDAAYYLRLAQDLCPRTLGPGGEAALDQLEREREHFNAALAWAVEEREIAWGLLMASELVALWNLHGHLDEGRDWIAKLLALPEPPPEQQTRAYLNARAHGLSAAASITRIQGDTAIAREYQVAAQDIRARLGDRRGVAESLIALGFIDLSLRALPLARAELEEALRILREGDETRFVAVALLALSRVALQEDNPQEAERLATESLAAYERHGDRYGSTGALTALGELAAQRGDLALAAQLHERCLALSRELRFQRATALSLMSLGSLALRRGDHHHARALLKDSAALFRADGLKEDLSRCQVHLAAVARAERG